MNHKLIIPVISAACALILSASGVSAQKKLKQGLRLPPAVAAALKTECPDCVISKVTKEKEGGVTIYDFEFRTAQGEMDIAADGTVTERETPMKIDEVPGPVMEAIRKSAAGAKIKLIGKDEIRFEVKDGKVTKLDSPKYAYEADLVKGEKVAEVVVTPDGHVTEGPKWKRKGSKED